MNRYVSSKTTAGALVVLSALLALPLAAAELNSLWGAGARKVQAGKASQDRVAQLVDATRKLDEQRRTIEKEIEGLKVFNTLMARRVSDQEEELTSLAVSIDQVTVIERQILPLMTRMIDGIEAFVALDVPFHMPRRHKRIRDLRAMMEQADITAAEKFRRVTEALQIENDYGKTIDTYPDTLTIGDQKREVDILQVGRVGLYYQTADAGYTGMWDQSKREWLQLDGTARSQVQQGLRIARKQVPPDLLVLPVPAPEAAQ